MWGDSWGDSYIGEVLTMQARGPELVSWHPHKQLGVVGHHCDNDGTRDMGAIDSPGLSG